jgi:hypothetical protein
VCNDRDAAIEVLDALASREDPVARTRIARMHGRGHAGRDALARDPRLAPARDELLALNDIDGFELEMG